MDRVQKELLIGSKLRELYEGHIALVSDVHLLEQRAKTIMQEIVKTLELLYRDAEVSNG